MAWTNAQLVKYLKTGNEIGIRVKLHVEFYASEVSWEVFLDFV